MAKWALAAMATAMGVSIMAAGSGTHIVSQANAQAQPQSQRPAPRPVQRPPAAQPHPQAAPSPAPAPAPGAASAPQRIETIIYDAWSVTCRDTLERGSKKACSATLQVSERERNRVLFAWTIGHTEEGKLMSVLQTPTGVQVGRGVDLKVGETAVRKINYASCEPQRCQATIEMDAAMMKDMNAAANAVVTAHAIDGRDINFNIPIKGADKALSSVRR